jgi:hypothetical protein
MTTFVDIKNLAVSQVVTPPSPATSGTTAVLTTGTSPRFSLGPAIISPVNTMPEPSNSEVILITAINTSTDTITYTRAQESSTARSVVAGDVISQGITRAMLIAVYTAINNIENVPVVTDAGGARTLGLTDANKILNLGTGSSAFTLTIPLDATADLPIGSSIVIKRNTSGVFTITATTGVALARYSASGDSSDQTVTLSAGAQESATLTKVAANSWWLVGNVT